MTNAKSREQAFNEMEHEWRAIVHRAADLWNEIAPVFEAQEVDSIRKTELIKAVHNLAMLHPGYDRFRRRVKV